MTRVAGAVLVGCVLLAGVARAEAPPVEGRWEGEVRVPGEAMPLVLDLAPEAGGAGWNASLILPGRFVKGAPARDVAVGADGSVKMTIAAAFQGPADPSPALALRPGAKGALEGEFTLAGLTAPVSLHRTGPAQVDRAPRSTPVADALVGTWTGGYELGGYPRKVTLTLGKNASEAVIVGKRTTRVPFDLVMQGPHLLTLTSTEYGLTFEFRPGGDTLDGTLTQGPFEAPVTMHRAPAGGRS